MLLGNSRLSAGEKIAIKLGSDGRKLLALLGAPAKEKVVLSQKLNRTFSEVQEVFERTDDEDNRPEIA